MCRRSERAAQRAVQRGNDPTRKVAILVVAFMAGVATFSWVGALLDTR